MDITYDFSSASRFNTNSLKWDVKEGELPMWVADMDIRTAPEITRAIVDRARHGVFGYSIIPDEWYEAHINWWQQRHGLAIEREWMQFTTGVVPAISSIVRHVTAPNDSVVVLTPVYNIFFNSIENAGRTVLESPLVYEDGQYRIDFCDLEEKLSRHDTTLMILCDPHNPIGKIWSAEELKSIALLAKKHGVTVISDEIHCDIVVPGHAYTPFLCADEAAKEISVTCVSASKAFNLAGLQSAAVIIPNKRLFDKVVKGLNSDEVAEPNCFAVQSAVAAFTEGERWLDCLNAHICQNKNLFEQAALKLGLTPVKGHATYLLWVDVSAITDDATAFTKFLRDKTGLYISSGGAYRGNGKSFVRINVACGRETALDGVDRFERGTRAFVASHS